MWVANSCKHATTVWQDVSKRLQDHAHKTNTPGPTSFQETNRDVIKICEVIHESNSQNASVMMHTSVTSLPNRRSDLGLGLALSMETSTGT